MSVGGPTPLPTAEEILAGDTQAGVPRPAAKIFDDEDDGSVDRIGDLNGTVGPASTVAGAARILKAAIAERDAASAAMTAASDRVDAANRTLSEAQAAFYREVEREFLA